jgi:hypothetical protein
MLLKNHRNSRTSTRKNFNLEQFYDKYYMNDDVCKKVFVDQAYPNGYVCEECGNEKYSWIKNRKAIQCTCCNNQNYILSDTIFRDSKLSFFKILLGIYYFVSTQSGSNGSDLANYMCVNINTARLFLRRLREACEYENNLIILENMVDLDGIYVGGTTKNGKRGLGSEKKQTAILAIEMIDVGNDKIIPRYAAIRPVKSENGVEAVAFAKNHIKKGTKIRMDGSNGLGVLGNYKKDYDGELILDSQGNPITKYGYEVEQSIFDPSGSINEFVHIYSSNLTSLINGTYHGVSKPYLDKIIAEFNWRFNNRYISNNEKKMKKMLKNLMAIQPKTQKQFKLS